MSAACSATLNAPACLLLLPPCPQQLFKAILSLAGVDFLMSEAQIRSTLRVLRRITGDPFRYATQQPASPATVPQLPAPGGGTPAPAPAAGQGGVGLSVVCWHALPTSATVPCSMSAQCPVAGLLIIMLLLRPIAGARRLLARQPARRLRQQPEQQDCSSAADSVVLSLTQCLVSCGAGQGAEPQTYTGVGAGSCACVRRSSERKPLQRSSPTSPPLVLQAPPASCAAPAAGAARRRPPPAQRQSRLWSPLSGWCPRMPRGTCRPQRRTRWRRRAPPVSSSLVRGAPALCAVLPCPACLASRVFLLLGARLQQGGSTALPTAAACSGCAGGA